MQVIHIPTGETIEIKEFRFNPEFHKLITNGEPTEPTPAKRRKKPTQEEATE